MAEYMMNVPHYRQRKDMSCWLASARMVKCYKKIEQVIGLPDYFANNWGVQAAEVELLAKAEGFEKVPEATTVYTIPLLINRLRRLGPIWINMTTNGGGQHAIVITGASNEMGEDFVIYNDPGYSDDEGLNAQMTLALFTERFSPQQLYYPKNMP